MGYRIGTRTMGTKNASSLDMPRNQAIPEEGQYTSTYNMAFVRGNNKSMKRPSPTLRIGGMALTSPMAGGISASSRGPSAAKPIGDVNYGLMISDPSNRSLFNATMNRSASDPTVQRAGSASSSRQASDAGRRKPVGTANMLGSLRPREARRALLETLSDPDVEDTAKDIFDQFDYDGSRSIEAGELMPVLMMLHEKLGIQRPIEEDVQKLLKRHDHDKDNALKFPEFFELVIAELRRAAFDRSTLFGREFFVTKQPGRPWDNFERLKELGTGSFGTAYLCKHKRTQEEYVVKAVKKSRAKIPVEDIEKEIMVMRQVDHPHLVRLFDWYEDQGRVYLVLEALKGGTLKDVIMEFQRHRKGLKEAWTRSVCAQTMSAIAYCHHLRLVHKDLKDENIMLLQKDINFEKPYVVVIDLGIAEMFSLADPTGQECGGTPTTMAPEVWNGSFGPKCDVFSMGCVLYEMLAGCMPFIAHSMKPVQWTRLHKKGADFSRISSSPQGKELCKLMLLYDDEERPSMTQCMKHEWFQTDDRELRTVSPAQLQALESFCNEAALKRTLLLEIASKLPMSRCMEVVELFEAFDTDRDGTLTPEELQMAFRSLGLKDDKLIKKIFKSLDVDNDGFLSFSEFAAGILSVFGNLVEERMHALFKEFDEDSDGVLTRSEVEEFLANAALLLKKDPKSRSTKMLQEMMSKGKSAMKYEEIRDLIFGKTKLPDDTPP